MPVRKILIVDDSATNRHGLSEMLARHGYKCSLASSGKEAIEKAKTEKPDMILMDVVMPDMDGFQATRAITRDEETKHIPIILCTGFSEVVDGKEAKAMGIQEFMMKPFSARQLAETIRRILGARD